jgi:hypothetical protein
MAVPLNFVPGDAGDHRAESWTLESSAGSFHYSYNPAIIGRIARLEISP